MIVTAALAPPSGHTLLVVGQDVPSIAAYSREVGGDPAGYAAYTAIADVDGLEASVDHGGGLQHARAVLDTHPNAVLQLGLYMVGQLERVADGTLDTNVDRLAGWIKGTRRPVYLRVGYEFDLPENHYAPEPYRRAFRHLVDRFRRDGVRNCAFVWHSQAQPGGGDPLGWYPGDGYVDWFAVSCFDQKSAKELDGFANLAKRHRKPLMVAESAPWRLPAAEAWNRWYAGLFRFVERHDVAMLCSIFVDWDALPIFAAQHWGDTRLSTPDLRARWLAETARPRYLHAKPDLFARLGYRPR